LIDGARVDATAHLASQQTMESWCYEGRKLKTHLARLSAESDVAHRRANID
jgi:hypothetical protein